MRIAIVSDIHGNRTAFEAVLADLQKTSPDLILHGGDLPHGGASPAEIVDRIRDLGWSGVVGNTDEMLWAPHLLRESAPQSPQIEPLFAAIEDMAAATCEALGKDRISWLRTLPRVQVHGPVALVHASPKTTWQSPLPEASEAEFEKVYGGLERPIAVYGHIHRPFIRALPKFTVVNSGSVSLSYDGDPRASYLLIDDSQPTIRRVAYDVDAEIKTLAASRLPHAAWLAKILRTATFQMP